VARLILGALLAALLSTFVFAGPAAARTKPITGKLSKRGYTVIALATNGSARSTVARPAFTLVPPSSKVTLQLRDANGHYAGPVVVGRSGKRAIVGVKAGAKLGRVRVRNGFATARVPAKLVDPKALATARGGVPIGARNLGRVRAKPSGRGGRGRDLDHDGVPGAFDVDDDGDLTLDNVDRNATGARAAVADPSDPFHPIWVINSGLQVSCLAEQQGFTHGTCGYAVNQNAAGPFAASAEFQKLIDVLMQQRGEIYFPLPAADKVELDCGKDPTDPSRGAVAPAGLTYCVSGGTGAFHTRMQRFPDQFDADGNRFGQMQPVPGFAEGQDGLGTLQTVDPKTVFGLAPFASAANVKSGDTYVERLTRGGTVSEQPVALGVVFGTLPALASWTDGSRTVPINYPVPTGAEGSESNAFTVVRGADGDYRVTLTIWRPQRAAIPASGETGSWIDMGGLRYTVVGKTAEQNRKTWRCPASAYSENDPNLSATSSGLQDAAPDRAVSRANTLTFTANLSECFRFSGLGPFNVTNTLFVTATSAYGDAAEGVGFSFKPQPSGGFSSSAFSGTWRFAGGAPGNTIDFTAQANQGSASRFLIVVYDNLHVTGGTSPAGWSCHVGRAQRDGDAWECTGGTLSPGQPASGQITMDGAGHNGQTIDLVACTSSDVCQGFGMTQQP
jgi:hypothetical protein